MNTTNGEILEMKLSKSRETNLKTINIHTTEANWKKYISFCKWREVIFYYNRS